MLLVGKFYSTVLYDDDDDDDDDNDDDDDDDDVHTRASSMLRPPCSLPPFPLDLLRSGANSLPPSLAALARVLVLVAMEPPSGVVGPRHLKHVQHVAEPSTHGYSSTG